MVRELSHLLLWLRAGLEMRSLRDLAWGGHHPPPAQHAAPPQARFAFGRLET